MKLKEILKQAFAIDSNDDILTKDELALLNRLSDYIVHRRMTEVAIMLLETVRPLNFIGSQALAFLSPLATMIFKEKEYEQFIMILEKRNSIPTLINKLEEKLASQKNNKTTTKQTKDESNATGN